MRTCAHGKEEFMPCRWVLVHIHARMYWKGCDRQALVCRWVQGNAELAAVLEGVKAALGLARFESFRVVHCAHAFGCALASADDGWSLALSGDTRPCNAVVAAAKDATVLIQEACRPCAVSLCRSPTATLDRRKGPAVD